MSPDAVIAATAARQEGNVTTAQLRSAGLSPRAIQTRVLLLTSPARLMLDLAATQPLHALERAYNEAQVRRLLTPGQLHGRLEGRRGRRGVAALREPVDGVGGDAVRARGRLQGAAALGRPAAPELDGRAVHEHRGFEGDRAKGNRLALAGWVVPRFTHRRIRSRPLQVVAELVRALERRP